MNRLIYYCILLAERSRLDSLSSGFRGRRARFDANDLLIGLMILGGVAVAIWMLTQVLARQEKRQPCNKPGKLFCSLCKAHGLRLSDWWLLWRLARHHRLRDPARLFLEPEWFDPTNMGGTWQVRAEQLEEIGEKLFGGLSPAEGRKSEASNPWSKAEGGRRKAEGGRGKAEAPIF